jgi:hypothetical protein
VTDDIKVRSFIAPYAPDCRKRHEHHRRKSEVIKFVVQLKILIKGHWFPAIRYDTAHDFAHCDILHHDGKVEKIRMPTLDYNEALTYADQDLSENWSVYRERYLREVPHD